MNQSHYYNNLYCFNVIDIGHMDAVCVMFSVSMIFYHCFQKTEPSFSKYKFNIAEKNLQLLDATFYFSSSPLT